MGGFILGEEIKAHEKPVVITGKRTASKYDYAGAVRCPSQWIGMVFEEFGSKKPKQLCVIKPIP